MLTFKTLMQNGCILKKNYAYRVISRYIADKERMHFEFAMSIQLNKRILYTYCLKCTVCFDKKMKAIPTNHERCAVLTANDV